MKNRKFELHRRKMKEYLRNNPVKLDKKGGIKIYHVYGEYAHEKAWWDDVGFIRNNYKVTVWFVHPRMKYHDEVTSGAWDLVPEPEELKGKRILDDWFNKSTANYKKVGKSRKKIVTYEVTRNTSEREELRKKWYDDLKKKEEELLVSSDFTVKPSMVVTSLPWCKGVELCVPIEVVDEVGLHQLKDLVTKVMNGETTIEKEFPGYVYGRDNWNEENVKPNPIHSVNL